MRIIADRNELSQERGQLVHPLNMSYNQENNLYLPADGNHRAQKFTTALN